MRPFVGLLRLRSTVLVVPARVLVLGKLVLEHVQLPLGNPAVYLLALRVVHRGCGIPVAGARRRLGVADSLNVFLERLPGRLWTRCVDSFLDTPQRHLPRVLRAQGLPVEPELLRRLTLALLESLVLPHCGTILRALV